ncbi:hypothetical protein BJ742DRAFT_828663 [Cladochytrium replicatum]|nr:hypothetical protein BJ742DRAFT_828663 [Cladochytrium replicatum]
MSPTIEDLFKAIKASNSDEVRDILLEDKTLTSQRHRDPTIRFEVEVELDAYKFLGAYIGAMTALQLAILTGNDSIARDIIERTLKDDLDLTFGGGNTALHLATFVGAKDLVKLLLERGANRALRNSKGFAPVDVVDDTDMRATFETATQ